jgi:hypothetical protein
MQLQKKTQTQYPCTLTYSFKAKIRPQPFIVDKIDLDRRETITGRRFSELRDMAYKKKVPWIVVPILIASPRGFVIDYLDGYSMLNEKSKVYSVKEAINNFIKRKYSDLMSTSVHTYILVYPNDLKSSGAFGSVGETPFNELDSVAKVYFHDDKTEILSISRFFLGLFEENNSIPHAKIAKFWLDQVVISPDNPMFDSYTEVLKKVKTYLLKQKDRPELEQGY